MNTLLLLLSILLFNVNAQWLLLEEDAPTMLTTEDTAKIAPRHECSAWCVDDDIYVYGGSDGTSTFADFWKYETENRRWLWMPDPPVTLTGRKNMAYWTIQGEIYMFGGDTELHGIVSEMWLYQPTSRKWSLVQPSVNGPSKRESMAFWSHKPSNQIYIYGGYDGNQTLDELWSFNIATKSWNQISYAGMGPGPQRSVSAVLGRSEDTVYYFADRLYQLDITTMTWSITPTEINAQNPDSRVQYSLFMTATQDKISLFGGHVGSKLYSDYWLYDPSVEQWIQSDKSSGPSGRWGACGCTDNRGDYYMFGGTFEDPTHFHNDLWKNGPLTAKNIFQILDFKLDTVTLASLVAGIMSTILVCVLFFALLCVCVRKCRKERHLINSYKVDSGPLTGSNL